MHKQVRGLVLLSALALAGCTPSATNTGPQAINTGPNIGPEPALTDTQAPDAARGLDALALLFQANAAATAAAAATGFVTLTGNFISPSPAPTPSPSPSPTPSPAGPPTPFPPGPTATPTPPPGTLPAGTPSGTDVQTTFFTDEVNTTTTVRQTVTLAGGSAGATGTDTITLVFSGLVSQTADNQGKLLELRDTTQFQLKSSQHELSESVKARTRGLKRVCTFGATTSCTLTLESESAKIAGGSTILNGAESGGGTAQLKSNSSTAEFTFTWNADGSGTLSLPGINGLSLMLNQAANGTFLGSVTTAAGVKVFIYQNATGSLYIRQPTTGGTAAESDA